MLKFAIFPYYHSCMSRWELLKWPSDPHRKFAQTFYEILRIPHYFFTSSEFVRDKSEVNNILAGAIDMKNRTLWSMACEERVKSVENNHSDSYFHYNYAVDEVCRVGNRPLLTHPDLLVSQWYDSYTTQYATSSILQVWRESDWKSVVNKLTAGSNYEIIDQFFLAISAGQLYQRLSRPVLPLAEGRGLAGISEPWEPALGPVTTDGLGLKGVLGEGFVNICAINSVDKEAILLTENGTVIRFTIGSLRIQLDLREGDDFGIISQNLALKNSLDINFIASTLLRDDNQFGGMGSRAAVRSRRPSVPLWLENDNYFLVGSPDTCPRSDSLNDYRNFEQEWERKIELSCEKSVLSKLLNVTMLHPCDIEMVRNGTIFRPEGEDFSRAKEQKHRSEGHVDQSLSQTPIPFTIAMTTCRRLGHFLSVAKHIESFVYSFSESFVTEVMVVDDGSPDADRLSMLRAFPNFTFIFKSIQSRGHAASLNMIMKHVTTRFFLYLEDDWKLLREPILSPPLLKGVIDKHNGNAPELILQRLIRISIQIIEDSLKYRNESHVHEPITQVFLNDQRTSPCAMGLVSSDIDCGNLTSCQCDAGEIGYGGWPREAVVHKYSKGNKTLMTIPYSLHEFGLRYEVNHYHELVFASLFCH